MCTAALQYARRGWPVFPCREKPEAIIVRTADGPKERIYGAKSPYTGKGGLKNATTDERQIVDWWRKWPKALIGLPMGGQMGLFALDFDPRHDEETGEEFTLEKLKAALEEQMGCPLPVSLASRTQSGGVHVFFRQPDGEAIRNRGCLPVHVDVRGEGGYVIAPPSVMENGAKYRWIEGRRDTDPVDAPVVLIDILRQPKRRASAPNAGADQAPPASPSPVVVDDALVEGLRKYGLTALDGELRKIGDAPHGRRNITINERSFVIGQLVGAGALTEATARAAIREIVDRMPNNEDPAGAYQTIDNGLSAGMANPRDLRDVIDGIRQRASRSPRASSRPRTPSGSGEGRQSFRSEGSGGSPNHNGGQGGGDADDLHRRSIFKPHTDLGNAERFFERFGRDFRWSPALGWLGWDERRWITLDQDDKNIPPVVLDAVFKTIRAIQDEGDVIEASGGVRPDWLDMWNMLPEEQRVEKNLPDAKRAELALYRKHQAEDEADDDADAGGRLNSVVDWKKGRAVTRAEAHRKWGRTSEAAGKLGCIAKLAQPWLAVKADAFDIDPLAINVLNGTLRFRRTPIEGAPGKARWKVEWRLDPHDRDDLISKLAPVEFDKAAACPIYDDMLEWAQPDADMRRYLHQWGGLSFTGHMGEQILQYWYGLGGNGKSTTIDAWAAAAGDYATTVPIETFLDQGVKKRGDQATPDLAKLGGVRMLRTSEPERNSKLAAALIKLVTGGEPMSVRFLNRGFFDLRPIFKLTISGNYRPDIPDTDDGIWRRLKLIPWEQRVKDELHPEGTRLKDTDLPGKLLTELSGIFNRLLQGLLDWLEHGLIEPASVTSATADYRTESDPLARFLSLCTRPDPKGDVRSSKLHELFVAWCAAADERAWTQKGFSKAMADKGYRKKASDGMHWLGIVMTRETSEFVDGEGKPVPFSIDADDVARDDEPPPKPRTPPRQARDFGPP